MVVFKENTIDEDAFDLAEFKDEVFNLLDLADNALKLIELINSGENPPQGKDFGYCFNVVFRSLHSIKGASSMFHYDEIVEIVHHVETMVCSKEEQGSFSNQMIDYLRRLEDKIHYILDGSVIEMPFELIDPDGKKETKKFEESKKTEEKMVEAKQEKEEKTKSLYQFDVPTFCQNITEFKPKILILDDDVNIRDTMIAQIETEIEHAEFIECEDPQEAIEKMTKDIPDLLIVDYFLPKYSGKEFLRHLPPIFKKLPILMITGKIIDHSLLEVMNEGADVLIEKPYNELQFKKLIRSYLEKLYYFKQLNSLIDGFKFQFTELEKKLVKADQEEIIAGFRDNIDLLWDAKQDITKFNIT